MGTTLLMIGVRFLPCRKAVEDYRRIFNIGEKIQIIDWSGIYWKKEKDISEISRAKFDKLI